VSAYALQEENDSFYALAAFSRSKQPEYDANQPNTFTRSAPAENNGHHLGRTPI
jgi:hypothetical protein